jgi:hypothetical protein
MWYMYMYSVAMVMCTVGDLGGVGDMMSIILYIYCCHGYMYTVGDQGRVGDMMSTVNVLIIQIP